MSNAKPRPVAEINLEEFERRLRASAAPQAGVEDPLAELTRLVDSIGFERTPSERALDLSRAARPATPPPRAEGKPDLRLASPAPPLEAPKPPPPPPAAEPPPPIALKPPAPAPVPEPLWDEEPAKAEPEAELRPSFQAEDLDSLAFDPPTPSSAEPVEVAPAPKAAPRAEEPARSRHWGLKVGGLVAASVVMIGAVVVFKVGGVSHSGAPPLILASTAPTKVAPPNEETIRTANESGNLLNRDTAQPTPTPPKLVDPPEAPVDLSARPQPSASPAPAPAATVAEASPVAPSTDTPIVAATPKSAPVPPVGADPSRVKTISVRPDGTLISSGYEAAQAPLGTTPVPPPPPAQPEKPAVTAAADGEAASPAVALPTKLAPPKSAARVVNKSDTTAPAEAAAAPPPAPVKPKHPKPTPTPVAEAEPTTDDATAAPAQGSGGYAVQLAAPKSESDAKGLVRSLASRYSGALSGASLGIRKAERNGETIYRVRAMGLSKSEAAAMCSKVKSAGGDCYVAKN